MKKKIKLTITCLMMSSALLLAGCTSQAENASQNVSKEADNFNIQRRVVVINTRTDKVEFECNGKLSIDSEKNSGKRLEITVKTGTNKFKKHFVNLTQDNMYVVEDISGAEVSPYQYEVNYQPKSIVPFKITEDK